MHQAQVARPRDADQIGVRSRVLPNRRKVGMCSRPPALQPAEVSMEGLCLELPRKEVQRWEPAELGFALPAHNAPLAPR